MLRVVFIVFAVFLAGCTKPASGGSDGGGGGGGGGEQPRLSTGLCGENLRISRGQQCGAPQSSPVALLSIAVSGQAEGLCSGTLITAKTILTAAHCIDPRSGVTSVSAGFPTAAADRFDIPQVARTVLHPAWNGNLGNPHDVGLLILKGSVGRSPVPIVLSTAYGVSAGQRLRIYGFGKDEFGNGGRLKLGTMTIQSFGKIPGYGASAIIALSTGTGQSICGGDSGAPLVYTGGGAAGLIGVANASRGSGRCGDNTEGLFASVQIDDNLNFIVQNKEGALTLITDRGLQQL